MSFPATHENDASTDVPATLIGQFYAERNREYTLSAPVWSIGRSRENSLRIRDERVSPRHVAIKKEGSRYVLEAQAADAVTTVNGQALRPGDHHVLEDGDMIGLSGLKFRFLDGGANGALSRLWVLDGVHRGKLFRIDRSYVTLGRAADNDIQFPDRSVSRHHCRIRHAHSGWWIEDLNSTNGTLLNGFPLAGPTLLSDGDEILLGFSRFMFSGPGGPGANGDLETAPPCD